MAQTYGNQLWGGEEVAHERCELAERTITDVSKFFTSRQQIEEKYAKQLSSITSKTKTEGGSIGVGWQSIRDQQNHQLATNYEHFVSQLSGEILVPIEAVRKQHFNDKSRLSNDMAQLKKEISRREAALNDKKTHYYKMCEVHEREKKKHDECSNNPSYPAAKLTKLQASLAKAKQDMDSSADQYREGVADYNNFKHKSEEATRALLNEYQEVDLRRLEAMRDVLKAYIHHIDESASRFLQFCSACKDQLLAVSPQKDMQEYLNSVHKDPPPEPDQYVEYKAGGKSRSIAGSAGGEEGAEVITPGYQPLPKVSVTLPDGPVLVRAEFDYSSSDEHDLKFKYGDIIVVRKQDDSGWWVGELFQREGLFPRSYVEIIDVNEHRKQAMLWPPPGFRTCIAKYDFAGEGEDELPLVEGQILVITDECEEWYIGEDDKGKIGMFPKVFVES